MANRTHFYQVTVEQFEDGQVHISRSTEYAADTRDPGESTYTLKLEGETAPAMGATTAGHVDDALAAVIGAMGLTDADVEAARVK